MLAYTRKVLPVDATDQERDRLVNTYEYQGMCECGRVLGARAHVQNARKKLPFSI